MIYWRRYPADYLVKTQRFSMLEDGAYGRLLDFYYTEEEPIPGVLDEVYDIAKATRPEEKKAVQRVLKLKFELRDGAYHNDRADQEIAVASKARENGAKNGTGKGTAKGTED